MHKYILIVQNFCNKFSFHLVMIIYLNGSKNTADLGLTRIYIWAIQQTPMTVLQKSATKLPSMTKVVMTGSALKCGKVLFMRCHIVTYILRQKERERKLCIQ